MFKTRDFSGESNPASRINSNVSAAVLGWRPLSMKIAQSMVQQMTDFMRQCQLRIRPGTGKRKLSLVLCSLRHVPAKTQWIVRVNDRHLRQTGNIMNGVRSYPEHDVPEVPYPLVELAANYRGADWTWLEISLRVKFFPAETVPEKFNNGLKLLPLCIALLSLQTFLRHFQRCISPVVLKGSLRPIL